MEERTKKRTGGGRGARCEVRGTLGRCGCGCLVYKRYDTLFPRMPRIMTFTSVVYRHPLDLCFPPPPPPLPRTTRIMKYVHSQHDTAHTCCSKMLERVVGSSPPAPTPPPFVVIQLVPCSRARSERIQRESRDRLKGGERAAAQRQHRQGARVQPGQGPRRERSCRGRGSSQGQLLALTSYSYSGKCDSTGVESRGVNIEYRDPSIVLLCHVWRHVWLATSSRGSYPSLDQPSSLQRMSEFRETPLTVRHSPSPSSASTARSISCPQSRLLSHMF